MRGAVAPGALELQHDITSAIALEPFVGDRGARDVAAQPFEFLALMRATTPAETVRAMAACLTEDFQGEAVRIVLFQPVEGLSPDWLQILPARDKRLEFVGAADVGDGVVLNVTLVKAYMEGLATSKNSTVVLRVRYGRAGEAIGDATFRGDHTDVNWGSGDGEARDSLNIALQEALAAIDTDLFARCSKPVEPKPVPAGEPGVR